jgi:uncharacterized protein (TIGR00730 family)
MKEPAARIRQRESVVEDRYFLEGPHTRIGELRWALGILWEFLRGFRALHFVGPCVTVFGSARFEEGNGYYEMARRVGAGVARLGFTVMTGGGPGIMEAANRGAFEANGRSVGCKISLPREQASNAFMNRSVNFKQFFVRKVLLLKYSCAFVILPGGFGTMDECFETLTLIQTAKILNFPVVVMGVAYWENLRKLLDSMVEEGTISTSDLDLLCFTDSVDDAVAHVQARVLERFGLWSPISPRRILGEKPSL